METQQHTIFGAGQVGIRLATHLAAAGYHVRLVRRSAPGPALAGVEWMQGDATDPAFATEACRGSATVYNCTNPANYGRWDGVLQPLFRGVWNAAAKVRARLVQLDNLYMYGRPRKTPFDEHTPARPCAHHGMLRKQLNDELWARHARGQLEVVVGHASDFFGPGAHASVVVRPDVVRGILAGRRVFMFGNVDTPHGYTYTPDVARALATLGTHDDAPGRAWHLPTSATVTTRTLLEVFARHAGTELRVSTVPGWVLRVAGSISPLLRGLSSMRYQWDLPYVLDDADFRTTFGFGATPLDDAVNATLAEYSAYRRSVQAPDGRGNLMHQ